MDAEVRFREEAKYMQMWKMILPYRGDIFLFTFFFSIFFGPLWKFYSSESFIKDEILQIRKIFLLPSLAPQEKFSPFISPSTVLEPLERDR